MVELVSEPGGHWFLVVTVGIFSQNQDPVPNSQGVLGLILRSGYGICRFLRVPCIHCLLGPQVPVGSGVCS